MSGIVVNPNYPWISHIFLYGKIRKRSEPSDIGVKTIGFPTGLHGTAASAVVNAARHDPEVARMKVYDMLQWDQLLPAGKAIANEQAVSLTRDLGLKPKLA